MTRAGWLVLAGLVAVANAAPADTLATDDVERAGHALGFLTKHSSLLSRDGHATRKAKETYFVRFAQTHMPHTQKMTDMLNIKTHPIPGKYNTTNGKIDTGGGCFQCTSGCASAECAACQALTYSADENVGAQFCTNQTRSYGFQTTTADTCGKCKCCSLQKQSSCKAASGICETPNQVDQCMEKMTDSPLYGTDPICQTLGKKLQAGDFEAACSSTCFPSFMSFYTDMYNSNCTEDINSQTFADVICGKICTPPAECMELADDLVDEMESDVACAGTVEAIGNMYTQGERLSRGTCGGRCWAKVAAAYTDLYHKDCFTCDSTFNVPSPALLLEKSCVDPPTPVPIPAGSLFTTCDNMVSDRIGPLREDHDCAWMFRALVSGKNLTTVCNSNCFAKYMHAYEDMFGAGCVPGEAIIPDDFRANICSLGVMQAKGPNRADDVATRASRVEATLALHAIKALTPTEFTLRYWALYSKAIASPLNVSATSVTLVDVRRNGDDLETDVSVKTPAAVGQDLSVRLTAAVEQGLILAALNTELGLANAPVYIPGIRLASDVRVAVKSFCDPAQNEVSNLCIDVNGCPTANPTVECCTTLMEAIGQGCDVNMEVCGTTMTSYVYDSCPMMSDELATVEEWYTTHQSTSITASMSDTFTQSMSPSNSVTPSVSPTNTISASPTAAPTNSPVDVYDLEPPIPMVDVSYAPPELPYLYWGKRQTCDRNEDGMLVEGSCRCNKGYTGTFCEIGVFHKCPRQCSDRGLDCQHGNCTCEAGYGGIDCSRVVGCSDLSFCSGTGLCKCNEETGCSCKCASGYKGAMCNENTFKCPKGCSNAGQCLLMGECKCFAGFEGPACDKINVQCPMNCSGHGRCNHETEACECIPGFKGLACDRVDVGLLMTPTGCAGCSGGGSCDAETQTCKCNSKYGGLQCSKRLYPYDCSDKDRCQGRGICDVMTGKCNCIPGYAGERCERVEGCPGDCNGHGVCMGQPRNATCRCRMAYEGVACEKSKCPTNAAGEQCSFKGICEKKNGTYSCGCMYGTRGRSCNITIPSASPSPSLSPSEGVEPTATPTPTFAPVATETVQQCESNAHCSDHGICDMFGVCDCYEGYEGLDCSQSTADNGDEVAYNEFSII